MKRLLLVTLLVALALSAYSMTLPRMFIQKLVLKNGKNPKVTVDATHSAKEYILKAWILGREDDVLSTQTDGVNSIAVRMVGDGVKLQPTVVASVQLGNFANQWQPGETLHLELTSKATKKKVAWDVYLTEGTKVLLNLKTPQVIPGK